MNKNRINNIIKNANIKNIQVDKNCLIKINYVF